MLEATEKVLDWRIRLAQWTFLPLHFDGDILCAYVAVADETLVKQPHGLMREIVHDLELQCTKHTVRNTLT